MHFDGGFQKLKFLSLAGLSNLNEILINEGALPLLKRLEMAPCTKLNEMPSGIQNFEISQRFIVRRDDKWSSLKDCLNKNPR